MTFLGKLFLLARKGISELLMGCVRLYQIFLSPIFGQSCRFTPTCSNYYIQAVRKHGPIKGSLKGAWRICRCNPWGGSGEALPYANYLSASAVRPTQLPNCLTI